MQSFSNNFNDYTQKKVLALHDLSCFGRSSLVPITAVLSVQGHQCVPLPTAVFSTHTAIPDWICTDLTKEMMLSLAHFSALGLRFDAIYSGFLSSAEQIDCVLHAAKLKTDHGYCLVDPVMGDHGTVYTTYTEEMTCRMSELCHAADIITPNVTEAAILLDYAPDATPRNQAEATLWTEQLSKRYHTAVVLTGLQFLENRLSVACHSNGKTELIDHPCVNAFYPGTGDIFASVLLGQLLCGKNLSQSATQAADFVRHCIAYTAKQNTDPMHGVQFEPLLHRLPGILA